MTDRERSILSIAELAAGRPLVDWPGAGKAPTAFRIWAYGTNHVDGKPVVFSERSAEALLAEQTSRGRLYSFDFDHRSILPNVTPEAGKAAGWHALEVREHEGKPELWATSCDWTAEARAGLEAEPPEWRYFSPCFGADEDTREVLSYVNCALTNNPLTHGIPALASAVKSEHGAHVCPFELHRDADETGVSGTGVVAEGAVFSDGTVALRWKTDTASTTFFDDVDQMMKVHGHGGATRLVYLLTSGVGATAGSAIVAADKVAPPVMLANQGRLDFARSRLLVARLRLRARS